MWAMTRDEPFAEFFPAARRFGFSNQELNHQVTAAMLEAVGPEHLFVNSVHEPCPCDVPGATRKAKGIHISSLDESLRRLAVGLVRGSIGLAHRLGATAVVVHSGEIPVGKDLERRMRELYAEGNAGTCEYEDLKSRLIEERAKRAPNHLEALRRSLAELAGDAEPAGVRLGLENRDHYYEMPLPDELEELLALRPEVIEYWHDAGHAEKLERLGFYSQREWLERFAHRMIGIHLHDNDGLTDHIAPGLGTVDWHLVSSFMPPGAIRTFEVRGFTTPEEIGEAQELLYRTGCIERHGPG